jgi:hypothetical protein
MAKPKKGSIALLVGTRKGGFVFRSDARRRHWSVEGPYIVGQNIHHFILNPRDGETLLAATRSDWWGPDIQRSRDWGCTWHGTKGGVRYEKDADLSVKCVCHIRPGRESEPGVDPAGLFRRGDGAATWEEFRGLNRHPTRKQWTPGAGGLIVHTILLDSANSERMFVAISAAGAFRSDDGGHTWQPRNKGTRADFLPNKLPEVGQCVHKLALAPGSSDVLYQQNHCGVYRSDSAGDAWSTSRAACAQRTSHDPA